MNAKNVTHKPKSGFRAWICFFIGFNIIYAILAAGLIALYKASDFRLQYIDEYYDLAIRADIQDTLIFKTIVSQHTSKLLNMSKASQPANPGANGQLEAELTNIACYVKNKDGVVIYDTLPDSDSNYYARIRYNYLILIQNGSISLYRSQTEDVLNKYLSGSFSEYEVPLDNSYAQLKREFDNFKETYEYGNDVAVVYAVSSEPANFTNSMLYLLKQIRLWTRIAAAVVLATMILAITLIIYSSVKREEKRLFLSKYASLASHIWLEIKLGLVALAAFVTAVLCNEVLRRHYSFTVSELALTFAILAGCFWFFYFTLTDLLYNKSEFFKQNSIRTLIRIIRRLSGRLRFERRMVVGFWLFISAELILIFLFFASYRSGFASTLFFLTGLALFAVVTIIYHRFISDTGRLVSQIVRIKSGDLTTRLELGSDSGLQEYAHCLNSIQSGMSKALEEQLTSERLKVELITNVSHDLKTPLTSIISYIDLLKKEELPGQAVEYVRILSEKADRLKTMIQDIFAVSKASSGNLDVRMEPLDLGKLVEQTLADMQEKIDASGLKFRVHHINDPLIIRSDGQKLYRVMQNLIDNALSYSLDGSRVHVRLWSENNTAVVEIKNTSKLELDFKPEEIVERFVRGDISRSGEGSGLGLSIAKTFTEACGGSFRITIDYDDFKVRLSFPQEPKEGGSDTTVHSGSNMVLDNDIDIDNDEDYDDHLFESDTDDDQNAVTHFDTRIDDSPIDPYTTHDADMIGDMINDNNAGSNAG